MKRYLLGIIFLFLLSNIGYCFDPLEKLKDIKDSAVGLGTGIFKKEKKLPKNIAVLPARGEGEEEDKKEIRTTFYNHISYKNYDIIKLTDIDSKLYLIEKEKGKKWEELTTKELGESLDAEGLIYIDILGIEKVYAALYASLTLKLKIRFVLAETGEIIWEKEDSVTERSGGIPTSPWGAISTAVSSAFVLRESVKIALTDKLCRNLAKEIPEPKVAKAKKLPQIYSVITNALDSPFKAQDEILVSLSAQEGLTAYFNIGNEKKAIQLTEVKPGEYLGKYVIKEGDSFTNQIITAYLFNPKEKTESNYIVPHAVTADTIPPEPISDLKISSIKEGLLLSWKAPLAEDLKDFVIMRGDIESPNYVEIGATSITEFVDKNISFGKKYFYRVYARDRAKNLSKYEEKSVTAVKRGPTIVTKEIRENTTFFSAGSPYVIEGDVYILKDVTLKIEEGVVLEFKEGSRLISMGKILGIGTKDAKIAFRGKNYEIAIKDAGERAFSLDYGILENGKEIFVSNSAISISNTAVSNFQTFLRADRKSDINLIKMNISEVIQGLDITNSNVHIRDIKIDKGKVALHLRGEVRIVGEKFSVMKNEILIDSEGNVSIDEIEVSEERELDFLRKTKGVFDIKAILPFSKSLKEIKEYVIGDIKRELGENIQRGKLVEAYEALKDLESISKEDYENLADIALYLVLQLKKNEEALSIYKTKKLRAKEYLDDTFGIEKNIKEPKYILTFVDVKLSLVKEKDDIEKTSATKAQWRAVKTYVETLLTDLDREKMGILNDKIIPKFSVYVPLTIPVYSNISQIMFDGLFMAFIDKDKLLSDLREVGLIGAKERDLKIAIVDCTGIGVAKRLLIKNLLPQNFPVDDFGIGHCDSSNYYERAIDRQVDIVFMIQEKVKISQSLVGGNLKTFAASLDISAFDPYLKKPLLNLSKGSSIYHMNEEDGKELSLKNSFESVWERLERELKSLEKILSQDEGRKRIKKIHYAEKHLPPIEIKVLKVEPVFSNNYKMYERSPFLKISITNNTGKDFEKLKVAVMMKEYMDFPTEKTIDKLSPLSTVNVDIEGVFNNKFLELTENSTIQTDIKIKYFKGGEEKEVAITQPVSVFEKHALTWNDRRKIAIFVTPRDPVIVDFSRDIIKKIKKKMIASNISYAIGVFEAMRAIGITYQRDPNSPYDIVSERGDEIDYVQFSRDTIKRKTGDCDDLVSLFSSLMESLGIETIAVDYPGHILSMFKAGISLDGLYKSGLTEKDVIIFENSVWIPVELTLLSENFFKAWQRGLENIKTNEKKGLKFVNIKKAWEIYKPPTLIEMRMNIDIPNSYENSLNSVFTEIERFRNEEILRLIDKGTIDAENAIFFLYKQEAIDDALSLSQYLLEKNIISSGFLNDIGNLYFLKKDYKDALRFYKKAYELDERNPLILANILKTLKIMKNESEYKTYKLKLEKIAPFLTDF